MGIDSHFPLLCDENNTRRGGTHCRRVRLQATKLLSRWLAYDDVCMRVSRRLYYT